MTRTLQELAQEAVDIQNACNPLGLTKSFAQATQEMWDLLAETHPFSDHSFDYLCNEHPAFHLWLHKLCSMAGITTDQDQYAKSLHECTALAKYASGPTRPTDTP